MTYLLRVELPDVPGSLGRVATAIGDIGANIEAIQIVEHDPGMTAINDIFIAAEAGIMPDSIVSACVQLDGVVVHWVSRYAAGANLVMDLEAVESMTQEPRRALARLVDMLPAVFRVDWAMHVRRDEDATIGVVHATGAAPMSIPDTTPWPENLPKALRIDPGPDWGDVIVAGTPLDDDQIVVMGRRGGPDFLDSEIARLGHLVALATTINRTS